MVKFDTSCYGDPAPFLDVEVYWRWGWHTRLYYKATDVHAYLCPTSSHPERVCKNIPLGVALRIRRLCSERREFRKNEKLFSRAFFPRRGYMDVTVRKAFSKASLASRKRLLASRGQRALRPGAVPFVFPYIRNVNVKRVLHSLHPILRSDNVLAGLFPCPQPAAFRRQSSLGDMLCRAMFPAPARRPEGCSACGNVGCPIDAHMPGGRVIVSATSGRVFRIQRPLTCTSVNVIYVITCKKCWAQGVGETENPRVRFEQYLREIAAGPRGNQNGICAITEHFLDGSHSVADVEFTLVDSVPATCNFHPAVIAPMRVRLEWLWINRLESSLNIRRNWRSSFPGGAAFARSRRNNVLDESLR